jgi:translation initiation factor IF-1
MPEKEIVEAKGEVIEALPNALFKILLDSGQQIIGHLSGKMRIHYIRLVPGDKVLVEMTPYDLSKGRVIRRLDQNESKTIR